MSDALQIACRVCGERVEATAQRCPSCECKTPNRAAFKKSTRTGSAGWVIAAALAYAAWKLLLGG